MGGDHGNLINGRWRAAGPGEGFAVAGAMGEELGRRPRSTAQELEEALGVLAESSQAWWGREARERAEAVRAMDILGALGDGAGDFSARVGLDEAGALELLSEDLEEREALEPAEVSGPGVALVRAAPTALLSGLTPLVEGALSRGWCVLLLADPTLPWLAEAVARAWSAAGGEPGALALLHDDGATTARSVLGSGQLVGVLARDHEARLAELKAALSPASGGGFGVGVVDPRSASASFEGFGVRDGTAAVTSGLDPEEEAAAVCEAAFGAAVALGGERDSSIGRVVCHEALFSAFTRGLLERFDALESAHGPLGSPLSADLAGWCEELSQSAVGDGATCLRGGPSDSIGRGGRAKITRSVFTNVEPNWRLSRASRPAPALALMRASSDEAVHKLARACDA